jgi:hydrogenase/urease accessory protein HupE
MKQLLIIAAAVFLSLTAPAWAHRLDEYLQATILSVERDHVEGFMRLVPGVAVSASVISSIDTNGDGTLSEPEQRAYALRVLSDLSLSIDAQQLATNLVSAQFPSLDEMRHGIGEIQLDFTADLPRGATNRRLIFENNHQRAIAAYLVNCLVPSDKGIRITAQERNQSQSFYQLEFAQADRVAVVRPAQHTFLRSLSGFGGAFRLGVRHIAQGTDHLLFLLALLLPAPLLACGSRWGRGASVRASLLQIVRIVTAFTLGHSLTLALAAIGLVHVPNRPIEVLIAASILVSAVNAMRPLFPGREAAIAAFFGLIHGLAFATALSDLVFDRSYQLASILGFNIGI